MTQQTTQQQLIFTNNVARAIDDYVASTQPPQVFVHVDTNTAKFVMPILLSLSKAVQQATVIQSPAGDTSKNLQSLSNIWQKLSDARATRKALLINLGGGVVTDMGALAASTYKRGIDVINVPTTLLGAVDAAVGGKTGINFNGIKNHIGTFFPANAVIISTTFFQTLTQLEMLSGYAEMIKHALLKDAATFNDVMRYDVTLPPVNPDALLGLLKESVLIKKDIVDRDPQENNLRKALNLGHTVGHALETFAMNDRRSPISHGMAVAQGLVVETILSHLHTGLDSDTVHRLAAYVKKNYGPYMISCDDYPRLLDYMSQDKKNASASQINFTLLKAPGDFVINQILEPGQITAALDIYRDLMGI